MQQKYIAIGVVVVVALAAVGGGIALMANPNEDNNNDFVIPEVTGKWNMAYGELADLLADNGEPLRKADDVKIMSRSFNPFETVMSFEVVKTGDHGFRGKFSYMFVNEIYGTLNGAVMNFNIYKDGILFMFEAIAHADYLSCSVVMTMQPPEGEDHSTICAVGYMIFIREGEKPVPIRSDYFDMSIMKAGNYIKSTLHTMEDFTEGERTGAGTEIGAGMIFSHAHNMISVFDLTDAGQTIGVLAVVTMGKTPRGTVHGTVAGNMVPLDPAGKNSTSIGNMYISYGKASYIFNVHHDGMTEPDFIEMEYNVPYYKGGNQIPFYLSEKHEYKGTLTLKSEGAEPKTVNVTKKFSVYDNTFYCETVTDGNKTIWFGEIYGHMIDIMVINEGLKEIGHLTGHVDRDLKIHIFGMMHSKNTGDIIFLAYDLELALPQ